MCTCISWPRWILLKKHLGGTSLDIAPHLASKEPFLFLCVWVDLLTLEMRNMWSEQGPAYSLNVLLFSSWSFGPWGMNLTSVYPSEGLVPIFLPLNRLEKQGLKINKRLL